MYKLFLIKKKKQHNIAIRFIVITNNTLHRYTIMKPIIVLFSDRPDDMHYSSTRSSTYSAVQTQRNPSTVQHYIRYFYSGLLLFTATVLGKHVNWFCSDFASYLVIDNH